MPILTNPKHEAFVQLTIQGAKYGWSQAEIYQRAGFKASGHSAEVAASRLMKKVEIRARLAELAAPAVRKTRTTVDSLAEQFDQVFEAALTEKQLGAAGTAAGLKAKLLGFMREKIEVGGPGAFDQCQTPEEIADKFIDDLGSPQEALETLDLLRTIIEAKAAERAQDVTPEIEPGAGRDPNPMAWLRPPNHRGR